MLLAGDHGFTSRNEISWLIRETDHEIYGAFDIGRVWGPLTDSLPRKTLSGTAIGVRGKAWKFGYDLYVAHPLSHLDDAPNKDWIFNFRAGVTF